MAGVIHHSEILGSLREYGLLDGLQAEQLAGLTNRGVAPDTEVILDELRRRQWLTPWQADQVQNGRISGLRFGDLVLTDFVHRGATSRIFKAYSTIDHRQYALKVLTSQGQADALARDRLQQEFEASRRVSSQFVARCEAVETYQNRLCLIRNWVDGVSVRQWVHEHGRYERAHVEKLMGHIAQGLAAIHAAGFRHGDVHSRHVILKSDRTPVWIDLGWSHTLGGVPASTSFAMTEMERSTHAPKGDARSDAFFLGCVFYELLAGGPPHPELDDPDRLKANMIRTFGSEIQLSRISNPPIPAICDMVTKMLDVHAERRLADAQVIATQLDRLQHGLNVETGRRDDSQDSLDTAELQKWLAGGGPASSAEVKVVVPEDEHPTPHAGIVKDPKNRAVLCVEAQEEIQAEFRKTFEKMGMRARMIRDSETAVDMARERAPDIIVYDADGQGRESLETFFELDRIASLGRTAPKGLLLLGPKQRKLQETVQDDIRRRYEILQKPLKMREVKTALMACTLRS